MGYEEAKQEDEKGLTSDAEKAPSTPRGTVTGRMTSQTGPNTAISTTYTSYNNSEAEDSEADVCACAVAHFLDE